MLGTDWTSLGRVALFALCGYVTMFALIRLLGARTISKMNPSDFVVTVAVGSVLANLILTPRMSLFAGLVGIGTLLVLQYATEVLSSRIPWLQIRFEGSPSMIFYDGHFVDGELKRQNVTRSAVYEAIREHGINDVSAVRAVVLEVNGAFSVIRKEGLPSTQNDSLQDVRRPA